MMSQIRFAPHIGGEPAGYLAAQLRAFRDGSREHEMMTVVAIMAGLAPIMWSHGAGSQVMKRIAAPMIGGMVSATILTLIVVPVIYALWKGWRLPEDGGPGANSRGRKRSSKTRPTHPLQNQRAICKCRSLFFNCR